MDGLGQNQRLYLNLVLLGLTGSQQKFLKENFGDDFVSQVISEPFEVLQQVPRLQFSEMEPILKRLNIPVTEEQ